MDVGCGNGLMLKRLSGLGPVEGLEVDTSMLSENTPFRERIYTEPLGADIYRDKQYDLITCLDVIEHIQNDRQAVQDMMNMLRPGGALLITVPAFMALWDEHDVINKHYRRYTTGRLRPLIEPHGDILELRYLFGGLFPPKLGVKLINKMRRKKIPQHGVPNAVVCKIMKMACLLEYRLTSWLKPPFGTSVLAVLRKPLTIATANTATHTQPAALRQSA